MCVCVHSKPGRYLVGISNHLVYMYTRLPAIKLYVYSIVCIRKHKSPGLTVRIGKFVFVGTSASMTHVHSYLYTHGNA